MKTKINLHTLQLNRISRCPPRWNTVAKRIIFHVRLTKIPKFVEAPRDTLKFICLTCKGLNYRESINTSSPKSGFYLK